MNSRTLTYLLLIIIPNLFYAQDILEQNENWAKYSKVSIRYGKSDEMVVYELENGKPNLAKLYKNDSLVSVSKINPTPEKLEKDSLSDGFTPNINLDYKIEIKHTKKGLVSEKYQRKFNGSTGYLEEEIVNYSYDQCNNITEEKRNFARLKKIDQAQTFDSSNKNIIKYRYEYDKDCLWTKKYVLDKQGEKLLVATRKIE